MSTNVMETRNRRIERYLTFPFVFFFLYYYCCLLRWLLSTQKSSLFCLLPRSTSFSLHAANGRIDQQVKTFKLVSFVGRRWRRSDVIAAMRSKFQVARITTLARSICRLDMDGRPRVPWTRWRISATLCPRTILFFIVIFFHRFFAIVLFLIRLLLLLSEPARYFA